MRGSTGRRPRPPISAEKLDEIALAYVARFSTTRARLRDYLSRKLRERGWAGSEPPDLEARVERLARLGYIDDAAYASARSAALSGRGYGPGRVRQALHHAGIAEDDAIGATEAAERSAADAALRFASRRRIGPFADQAPDRPGRERAIAAMIRAGHSFTLARRIVEMAPGAAVSAADLE